jgi:hypothetical protein
LALIKSTAELPAAVSSGVVNESFTAVGTAMAATGIRMVVSRTRGNERDGCIT